MVRLDQRRARNHANRSSPLTVSTPPIIPCNGTRNSGRIKITEKNTCASMMKISQISFGQTKNLFLAQKQKEKIPTSVPRHVNKFRRELCTKPPNAPGGIHHPRRCRITI